DPRGAADFFGGLLHGTRGPTLLAPAPLAPVTGGAPGSWATQQIGLSADATGQIQTVLRQHRIDLGALLECAWALLLASASGQRARRARGRVRRRRLRPPRLAREERGGRRPVRGPAPAARRLAGAGGHAALLDRRAAGRGRGAAAARARFAGPDPRMGRLRAG